MEKLQKLDSELFLLLNGSGSESWDSFWLFLTGLSLWYVVFGILVLLSLIFFTKRFWLAILGMGMSYGLADWISVHLFKNVFKRLRPCYNPELMEHVRLVVDSCGGQFGFVSSHAANSFALAAAAFFLFSKNQWVGLGLFSWALVTSYSRVYVGVHYPGDVLFGAFLGIFIAWAISRITIFIKHSLWTK